MQICSNVSIFAKYEITSQWKKCTFVGGKNYT